jgi:hypothetical protein
MTQPVTFVYGRIEVYEFYFMAVMIWYAQNYQKQLDDDREGIVEIST